MSQSGGDSTGVVGDAVAHANAHTEMAPADPLTERGRLMLVAGSLALLLYALVNWLLLLWRDLHSIAGRYDFSTYYAAAAALRANLHANIYDESVLARVGADAHTLVHPPLPYTYPPLFAILLSPLTFLSFRVVSRIWLLANAALWLGLVLLLANEVRVFLGARLASTAPADHRSSNPLARVWQRWRDDPAPLVALAATALLGLAFAPAVQTLALGQIDLLVLAPLALVPWLTRHGHERWIGVAIGLAAMLKLTPVLLIGYLLLRRRWQATLGALVTLAILAAVSAALVGPDHVLASIPQALRVGTGDATLGQNEALFAPLVTLITLQAPALAGIAQTLSHVLLVGIALWLAWFLWRAPLASSKASGTLIREQAGYGIALCAMLLLFPTAWIHHYVWTLPALVIALGLIGAHLAKTLAHGDDTTRDWRSALWLLLLLIVSSLALGWSLPYGWDTEQRPAVTHLLGLPLWPLLLELRSLGTIGVMLALSQWYAGRDRVRGQNSIGGNGRNESILNAS